MNRVLLVHQPSDGGVGRHICDVAVGLDRRGYEVMLCGPGIPAHLPRDFPFAYIDLRRAVAPRADVAGVAALPNIVRRLRPDVVHAHSSKAGAVARLSKFAYPKVPVVYTPHGYAFAGYFSGATERRIYRAVEEALAPLTSCVVCVCEAEARLARSLGHPERVRVIHNGVEMPSDDGADPRLVDLATRGPVVGAVTLLRPGKGLETLIDATPLVLARHPGAQIAIVGAGPDLGRLRARADRQGVKSAVSFLGPTEDPLSALRGMDVFVHPSWAESFPYVLLEAMSVGRPVIATDVGGVSEAVSDGRTGRLVRPRDPSALARAIAELLDSSSLRTRLGTAARARVMEEFTTRAMVTALIAAYEGLAGGSGTPHLARGTTAASEPPTSLRHPSVV